MFWLLLVLPHLEEKAASKVNLQIITIQITNFFTLKTLVLCKILLILLKIQAACLRDFSFCRTGYSRCKHPSKETQTKLQLKAFLLVFLIHLEYLMLFDV